MAGKDTKMGNVSRQWKLSRRSFLKSAAGSAIAAGLSSYIPTGCAKEIPIKPFEATWESLDTHRCPGWFNDAKLGMYFHWGICSVPAWAPRKEGISYAEWYWYNMNDRENPTWQYHRDTYGEHFTYDDFIPLFKAGHYNPEKWVAFAKSAGVQYIFVNAKHHDGFCLWPTRYTNRNAMRMGPKRDLIGPLIKAARKENLKVGFYYSFYEWYNPLYTGKPFPYAGLITVNNYVDDFMVPQVHELIELYHPDFLYFDGEWDQPPEFWKSRELVAHYYNQAGRRGQDVLVNDRFGKDSRGHHGDVYNVEYHYGTETEGLLTHKWSYWRGVGNTFGYNRDMNPEDCLTVRELIHMVVNGVSKNGNFDINVGPTADGLISDVEREPLLALGRWLRVNGEAIYGTRVWNTTEEGDIRFTAKGEYVYAIFLKWQGEKFLIRSVRAAAGSEITMLGIPGNLAWNQDENGLTIEFPLSKSRPSECAYAWAFKIRVS
ncbi:alpha-L-fucosidase [bacterium]|nr:alpha-L-fucosidase [bacterium]